MTSFRQIAIKTYKHFMHDSLRRNSTLLILSQAINAAAAFLFWIICTHIFKASTVGLATSIISFGGLIATFTNLGLPNTVIRFLPSSKIRGGLFMSSLYLVILFSIIGGVISLIFITFVVPKLGFIKESLFLSITLLLLIIFTSLSSLMDGTLMAFRKGEYILGKALLVSIPRLILPFLAVSLGVRGITGIYVIVFSFGIAYNAFIIIRRLLRNENLKPHLAEINKYKSYAVSNYLGGMFGILPNTVVPIIILSKLGAESAAYFYMPMQIAAFLGIICSSTSSALMSEASQSDSNKRHVKHFRNAFLHLYQILTPCIILLCLSSWLILRIYGKQYEIHGTLVLLLLTFASLFVGVNWLGDTWLNIQKRNRAYFLMNALNSFLVVGLVYVFAKHGLVAAGIGWLIGQSISALVYISIFIRTRLILPYLPSRTSA